METALSSRLTPLMPAFVSTTWATRFFQFDQLAETYESLRGSQTGRPLYASILDHLRATYCVSESDLERIPKSGPVIVVANHPCGLLEGAMLASLLRGIRQDVRFLANEFLAALPELNDLIIPVDVMDPSPAASRRNSKHLRDGLRFLTSGAMLVVFPAGEVSHFHWRTAETTDSAWNPKVARLVEAAGNLVKDVRVLPMHVSGTNSRLFQFSGDSLRTALLARELLNKRGVSIQIRVGKPITATALATLPGHQEQIDYLRWRTYLLRHRQDFKANTRKPAPWRRWLNRNVEPVEPPESPAAMASEVEALPPAQKLSSSGELTAYIAAASEIPMVLREIGRLREIAFRATGEGTGRRSDIDPFDSHYLHLFLWNSKKQEVAGAYRLAQVDQVRREVGVSGLYTASLFRFGEQFLDALGPALELGRSFVRVEYQKSFSPLLLLWKGIGQFVARNPRYRVLFGPVSISDRYSATSKSVMLSFLQRHWCSDSLARLVQARCAPRLDASGTPCRDVEQLSAAVEDLEPPNQGVPVLLRQYLRLGGKLLGFNVDRHFSNVIDGLILVDLTQTDRGLLERYLGKREAAQFLEFQKGSQ